jgi:hypothetical protein
VEGQGIELRWEDNSGLEDGYQLQRGFSSAKVTFQALVDLPANTTSYRDAEVSPYVVNYYRVQAKKDRGFSDRSNIASTCASGSEEICVNGIDDDCNGSTDAEDYVCNQVPCDWGCPQGYICDPDGYCASHCSDGADNADEGDVDCGGSCDAKCQNGQRCNGNWDCASNFCVNYVCQ